MRPRWISLLHSVLFGLAANGAAIAQAPATDAPLRAFEVVRGVLQHPRCQNCHIPGDAPLQGDDGHTHNQYVQRGPDGHGHPAMNCSTCHYTPANLPETYGAHAPPGAPEWRLPPPQMKMVFIGLSPRELCVAIKDRSKTAGRDLNLMLSHIRDDKLVAWGWAPGGERKPVPVSRAETVAAFKAWMDAGAPCPG